MSYEHDREFYRVRYPDAVAPRFIEGALTHRVVDIGEGGFRYVPADGAAPMLGSVVTGVIAFHQAEPLELEGIVVRVQADGVAVHCAKGAIRLAVVLREHGLIRQRYFSDEST